MEGCQSKCNYCIHALLRCSHFMSWAFKSECENRTLGLLQIFVGLVLLELSELSPRAFSQSGNYFSHVVPVMMLLTSVSEKYKIFQLIARAWHRNEPPKSAFWLGSTTYRLHMYRWLIGTQPYLKYEILIKKYFVKKLEVSKNLWVIKKYIFMHTTLKEKAAKIRIHSADMLSHLLIFSPLILGKNLLFHWKIQSSLDTEHSVVVNLFWEPTDGFFHITVLMDGIIPHQAYMTCNDTDTHTFVNCFLSKYQYMKVTSSKHCFVCMAKRKHCLPILLKPHAL